MAVPIAARDVAAVVGALLVLTAAVNVVDGTLCAPFGLRLADPLGRRDRRRGVQAHHQPDRQLQAAGPDPGRRSGDVPAQPNWRPGCSSPSSGTRCWCGRSRPEA